MNIVYTIIFILIFLCFLLGLLFIFQIIGIQWKIKKKPENFIIFPQSKHILKAPLSQKHTVYFKVMLFGDKPEKSGLLLKLKQRLYQFYFLKQPAYLILLQERFQEFDYSFKGNKYQATDQNLWKFLLRPSVDRKLPYEDLKHLSIGKFAITPSEEVIKSNFRFIHYLETCVEINQPYYLLSRAKNLSFFFFNPLLFKKEILICSPKVLKRWLYPYGFLCLIIFAALIWTGSLVV